MKKIFYLLLFLSYNTFAQTYVVVKPSQLPAATVINPTDLFILNQGTTTKKVTYSILNTELKDTFAISRVMLDSIAELRSDIGGGLGFTSGPLFKASGSTAIPYADFDEAPTGAKYYDGVYGIAQDTSDYAHSVSKPAQIGESENAEGGLFLSTNNIGLRGYTGNGHAHAKIGANGDSVVFYKNGTSAQFNGGVERIYTTTKGFIGILDNSFNIGIGDSVLNRYTTGNTNIGIGYRALVSNITGSKNIAIGNLAMQDNIAGNDNVSIGYYTGIGTGSDNVYIGSSSSSGGGNSGNYNCVIGKSTLNANTTGSNNCFFGGFSGKQNSTGNNNIALGYYSGFYAQTLNNRFYINSINRANLAGDTTKSLLHGVMAADVANQKLDINGRANIAEYITYKGTFAEIYKSSDSSAVSQSIPTGATPTKITGFTDNGYSSNCTPVETADKITATQAGYYKATLSLSYASGTANVDFIAWIYQGGTVLKNLGSTGKTLTANDTRSTSFSGIIYVPTVPIDIDYRVSHNNGGSVDLTLARLNLVLEYIGK